MTSPPRSAEHGNLSAFERFTRAVEWPMAILALTVVPALVLENRSATPEIARAALTVNWIIWTGFCGEYLVKLALGWAFVSYGASCDIIACSMSLPSRWPSWGSEPLPSTSWKAAVTPPWTRLVMRCGGQS